MNYYDEDGNAYIFNDYADRYIRAEENPYDGELHEAHSKIIEYYEEDDYEESPDDIWEQYMKWVKNKIQQNYKNTDYVKTFETQYLEYIIL